MPPGCWEDARAPPAHLPPCRTTNAVPLLQDLASLSLISTTVRTHSSSLLLFYALASDLAKASTVVAVTWPPGRHARERGAACAGGNLHGRGVLSRCDITLARYRSPPHARFKAPCCATPCLRAVCARNLRRAIQQTRVPAPCLRHGRCCTLSLPSLLSRDLYQRRDS